MNLDKIIKGFEIIQDNDYVSIYKTLSKKAKMTNAIEIVNLTKGDLVYVYKNHPEQFDILNNKHISKNNVIKLAE